MTPELLFKQALSLHQSGKLAEAETLYLQVVAAAPENFPTRYMIALLRYQQQRGAEALEAVEVALRLNPAAADALSLHGALLHAAGRSEDALASFNDATAQRPQDAAGWYNRGTVLQSLSRLDEALASHDKAVSLNPGHADAWFNRGLILSDLGRKDEAMAALEKSVALRPSHAEAWRSLGYLQQNAGRLEEALVSYDRCVALVPEFAEAWSNRGTVLLDLRRPEEALASLDRALAADPARAAIWHNRGDALKELKKPLEAVTSYDRALAIDPDLAEALNNRSALLWKERHYAPAVRDLEQLIRVAPDYDYAQGLLLHLKMHGGDWRNFDAEVATVNDGVRAGKRIVQPFVYQAISQSPDDLQKCSMIYANHLYPPLADMAAAPQLIARNRCHKKIRLGYMSGEMRAHAIGYLMVGVFEDHDKDNFELTILDNGWGDDSVTRKRIVASGKMIDITRLSNEAAAARIADEEIDILVNLNGYFGAVRMEIFARRPAPIQVNYLGLPATLGAPYMDYIVADACVIPGPERRFYTEKVVHLPDTYWPTDCRQAIATEIPSRADCGLPQTGFVFCNFNQSYKMTPAMFASWARIMNAVDGSVLWLLDCYDEFARNLRQEAQRNGIAGERIIFAPTVQLDQHLARLKLADLSLDSLPYNEHTTACDVLWAGVPLITCRGTTFPGRVAASLLHAMGLPELVSENLADYEALALALARDPVRLKAVREKLAYNRLNTALFDTARFTRNLEAAYVQMWETWKRGTEA